MSAAPVPPAKSRYLLTNLRIDHGRGSGPLRVPDEDRADAVGCIRQVLTEPRARQGHEAVRAEVFPSAPGAADPLAPGTALLAALGGPNELTGEELAHVLLSARAVADLADLLGDLLPSWWLDAHTRAGHQAAAIHLTHTPAEPDDLNDLDTTEEAGQLVGTGGFRDTEASDPADGPWLWPVQMSDAFRRRIAGSAFGDPDRTFELRLHRVASGTEGDRMELEMTPPPLRADVTVPVRFHTAGVEPVFVVPVPEEALLPGIGPEGIRLTTRSKESDPLPASAFGSVLFVAAADRIDAV